MTDEIALHYLNGRVYVTRAPQHARISPLMIEGTNSVNLIGDDLAITAANGTWVYRVRRSPDDFYYEGDLVSSYPEDIVT